jgi:hypothetical protein
VAIKASALAAEGCLEKMSNPPSGAKQAAEKGLAFGEKPEKQPSGAEARDDFEGFTRGINLPPPFVSSFSAACKARIL